MPTLTDFPISNATLRTSDSSEPEFVREYQDNGVVALEESSPAPTLHDTLVERHGSYGHFFDNSCISQYVKRAMRDCHSWRKLTAVQAEALELIATKLSRILTGNPNHTDNWRDIAGYAELVVRDLDDTHLEKAEGAHEQG